MNPKIVILFIITLAIAIPFFIWQFKVEKRKGIRYPKSDYKKVFIRLFILLVVLFIIGLISRNDANKDRIKLLSRKGITIGQIERYYPKGSTASDKFEFAFSAYGDLLKGEHIGIWPNGGSGDFIGKKFPVVFDSLDVQNHMMLIFPDDFKYYDMSFPDSLKWVLQYKQ